MTAQITDKPHTGKPRKSKGLIKWNKTKRQWEWWSGRANKPRYTSDFDELVAAHPEAYITDDAVEAARRVKSDDHRARLARNRESRVSRDAE